MELQEKISIDALNSYSVTIKKQRYIVEGGRELNVGDVHAKAYVNSENGRGELVAEVDEPYRTAILAMWGEETAIVEEEVGDVPNNQSE